jgi:hypothetical protein
MNLQKIKFGLFLRFLQSLKLKQTTINEENCFYFNYLKGYRYMQSYRDEVIKIDTKIIWIQNHKAYLNLLKSK